jgi:hypothetical protein
MIVLIIPTSLAALNARVRVLNIEAQIHILAAMTTRIFFFYENTTADTHQKIALARPV